MVKPPVKAQGKVIVEPNGDEFLIMFPDGEVVAALDKPDAWRKIRKWFKLDADADAFNVGTVEWR